IDDEAGSRTVHFQEWWVKLHAKVPALSFVPAGADSATPATGVLQAIEEADFILLPPSNPVVSIGIILAVPGIAEAVRAKTVVGVSPVIGGAPVRGMADACLAAIGVQTTAAAVASHYGASLLDGWLVDTSDAESIETISLSGITARALPLYMIDAAASAAIASAAIDLARELAGRTDRGPNQASAGQGSNRPAPGPTGHEDTAPTHGPTGHGDTAPTQGPAGHGDTAPTQGPAGFAR